MLSSNRRESLTKTKSKKALGHDKAHKNNQHQVKNVKLVTYQ